MNRTFLLSSIWGILLFSAYLFWTTPCSKTKKTEIKISAGFPYENYFNNIYQFNAEGLMAYKAEAERISLERKKQKKYRGANTPWSMEGPYNVGGRITHIAADPSNSNILFIGSADGGVFKSINGGNSWTPVFDNEATLSIGFIVINPNNSQEIYVGTGDEVLSGYSHVGNGMYKSTDGGNTWVHLGLSNVGAIAKIILDPGNAQVIYAATTGIPFIQDNNRGVYKSTDGGITWQNILFAGTNVGIGDLVMEPGNPQVLYATTRHRERDNTHSLVTGPATKIYKTLNGGTTWSILSTGLPTGDMCRIGLAISPANPQTIYAEYVDTTLDCAGIYKSTNAGSSWSIINSGSQINLGGFGWYFGDIIMNPYNANEIWVLGVELFKSTNGGSSFTNVDNNLFNAPHSDKHCIAYLGNQNSFLLGTDGGLYKTTNDAGNFTLMNNFPLTQFYEVTYSPHEPNNFFGGAQDNGSMQGNGVNLNNWGRYFGGDGFKTQFHPTDINTVYAEWQNGNVVSSDDYGNTWNYGFTGAITSSDVCNWNAPYIISYSNPNHLFFGSYRIWKNNTGPMDNWSPLSGDLTNNSTQSIYRTITSITQSPVNTNNLYAGTSNGQISFSSNYGNTWSYCNTNSLPDRYVTSVEASRDLANTVYVSLSGYRNYDSTSYIYRSDDNGQTWTSIKGDLVNFSINDIWIKDNAQDSILIAATDGGVYYTTNAGVNWLRLGSNMPIIPVYDIEYNPSQKKIIAGTFARSMQTFPVDSLSSTGKIISGVQDLKKNIHLYIYPNPAKDVIYLESDSPLEKGEIIIRDALGRAVQRTTLSSSERGIRIAHFPSGTYFYQYQYNGKTIGQGKFIKY